MHEIALAHEKTAAQVGLRWMIQKGISVIPKSSNAERIQSNSEIFDFTLSEEEMDLIDSLNQNYRCSAPPEDIRDIMFP